MADGRATMRFAYADPPYLGQAKRHYGDHPDYAGEVDHAALIADLEDRFDVWALSGSAAKLPRLLAMSPEGTRVLVWAKTNPKFFPPARLQYAWEPVLIRRRVPRPKDAPVTRDWVSCARVSRNPSGTHGSKPREFCWWLFDALGIKDGDEFVDLFPGDGAVMRHYEAWRSQVRMQFSNDRRARRRAGEGQQSWEVAS